jgi:hypothetical protein
MFGKKKSKFPSFSKKNEDDKNKEENKTQAQDQDQNQQQQQQQDQHQNQQQQQPTNEPQNKDQSADTKRFDNASKEDLEKYKYEESKNVDVQKKVDGGPGEMTKEKLLKRIIGIGVGSVVGAINFSTQMFGGTLTVEELTRYARRYEDILKKLDDERRQQAKIMEEKYKKLMELVERSEKNKEDNSNQQLQIIPEIIKAIDELIKKSEEYNKFDPEDPLHESTVPRLNKTKENLERYSHALKSSSH